MSVLLRDSHCGPSSRQATLPKIHAFCADKELGMDCEVSVPPHYQLDDPFTLLERQQQYNYLGAHNVTRAVRKFYLVTQ